MESIYLFNIQIFWYLLAAAFLLPKIPFIGKFFNIINTLIHEFGHALFALIFDGQVLKIQIFADTSGATLSKGNSRFANILVSLAGYTFSSLTAFFCFYLLAAGYHNAIIIGLSILFLFMLLFWIRNIYGILWVIIFLIINTLLLFYFQNEIYLQIAAVFYSLMILLESFWSPWVLLFLSIKDSQHAGDATNLQNFTHLPAVVWALFFVAFSCWMSFLTCKLLLQTFFCITL